MKKQSPARSDFESAKTLAAGGLSGSGGFLLSPSNHELGLESSK